MSCAAVPLLLAALLAGVAEQSTPTFPQATRTPSATTPEQRALIQEGIALHDQGRYDDAIARFQKVLDASPDNIEAIYEMAFSYFQKQDFAKSLELARRGAEYKSDLLLSFYYTMGNALDQLGQPQRAVDAYKAGLAFEGAAPAVAMLHFNLGVTYMTSLSSPEEAKAAFKLAARLNPNHPATHLLLGQLFQSNGYNTPAFFALARFLTLEPASNRSGPAFALLRKVLGASVVESPDGKVSIRVDPSSRKDEGDFTQFDLFLAFSKVQEAHDLQTGRAPMEAFVTQIDSLFTMLQKPDALGTGFTGTYYGPYFAELKKRGYVEPFVYLVSQRGGLPGVREWLDAHRGEIQAFQEWSASYPWPRSNP